MTTLLHLKNTTTGTLSKLQKEFNFYIQRIETIKKELIITKKEVQEISAKLLNEVIPLEEKLLKIHVKEINYLNQVFEENHLKRRDNETLSAIIYQRCINLLPLIDNEELKEIMKKHEIFHEIEEYKEEIKLKTETFEDEKSTQHISEKQLKKEIKRREEEKKLTKTSRQIYVELVKEFHPDLEKNDLEKERKNLLMHQITEAYEKDDLFELFRLRLELLGTDLENSTTEQVKYYVKLLKQQVSELENEVKEIKSFGKSSPFGESLYERFCNTKFQSLESKFKKAIADLKKEIKNTEQNLPAYRDISQVKYLVEKYRKY